MLSFHVLLLREEREEGEGESISPLGAEQGTLRECFGLRWAKRRQLSLSVDALQNIKYNGENGKS